MTVDGLPRAVTTAAEDERVRREPHRVFMQVPAAVCITRGSHHVIESANLLYHQLVGGRDLIGRSAREAFPDLERQGFFELLDRVYETGVPHVGTEVRAVWDLGDKLSVDGRKYLELLRARIHRMDALIDGLLQYSRAGRMRNRIETVDVRQIATEIVELLDPPATARIQIPTRAPVFETERLPLQQVLQNLVSNALKHSGRPDTYVNIAVREDGEFYEFTVSDNGCGIPRQFQNRVWEIFQTLQPRDQVEGAGIGLALVKKNVETRGGRAWLESAEAKGTIVHFLWPKRTHGED